MQALTAVEWLTAVRYETDGRLANGWTDGLPENRLTGLGAGLPLTISLLCLQAAELRRTILELEINFAGPLLLEKGFLRRES